MMDFVTKEKRMKDFMWTEVLYGHIGLDEKRLC